MGPRRFFNFEFFSQELAERDSTIAAGRSTFRQMKTFSLRGRRGKISERRRGRDARLRNAFTVARHLEERSSPRTDEFQDASFQHNRPFNRYFRRNDHLLLDALDALSDRVLALVYKLRTRGRDPFFFFLLACAFRLLFSREKVLRANVSLTSFCTMINIVRRYEIFFQRVSAPKRTRGQKIQTLAFEVNNNRSDGENLINDRI